jgi:A/G-specific adenine glycosylase
LKKLIIKGMDKRYFSEKVVKWYENNKRKLPWRETIDPYKIWLSEIILQQTRVSQGLPYYEAFIRQYPNVQALSSAPEQEVLRLWQGLGYYSRARNLHKCAKHVVKNFSGRFPPTFDELLKLPGVGAYTAAAIASFCFKQRVAVVDGNVFRVLSRSFGIDTPINSPEGKKVFAILANELITDRQPDQHNQAMMEFGATICTPKNPACDSCVFQKGCFAFSRKMQPELPVKIKPKKSRKRYFYYFVHEKNKTLWMKKREEKDIWNGLFDFHLIEKNRAVRVDKIIAENRDEKLKPLTQDLVVSKTYKHILSHQTIFTRFIVFKKAKKITQKNRISAFYTMKEIADLPKPVLVTRFLNDYYRL